MLYSCVTRDIRLPARYKWGLGYSSMWRSVDWQLITDVSEQPIGPFFRGQFYLAQVLNKTVDVLSSRFCVISAGGVQMCRTPWMGDQPVSIHRTAEKKGRRTCKQTPSPRALIVEVRTHLKWCGTCQVVRYKEGARKCKSYFPVRTGMTSFHSTVSRSRFRKISWNTQTNSLKYGERFQMSLEMSREFPPYPHQSAILEWCLWSTNYFFVLL
jgi:hypothetical protein